MSDLNITNIAPYLPYGLKVEQYDGDIGTVTGIGYDRLGNTPQVTIDHTTILRIGAGNILPLLHPMERFKNGEVLIEGKTPEQVIVEMKFPYYCDVWEIEYSKGGIPTGYIQKEGTTMYSFGWNSVKRITTFLNQHHFDYQGLIKQELAKPIEL